MDIVEELFRSAAEGDILTKLLFLIVGISVIWFFASGGWERFGDVFGEEELTSCNSACKAINYQYGTCRDEAYGCASDELDLGKDSNGCVDANCCCVTGCDYVCKDAGHESGRCTMMRECEEDETNLGSGICKTGWPTTAINSCCCI